MYRRSVQLYEKVVEGLYARTVHGMAAREGEVASGMCLPAQQAGERGGVRRHAWRASCLLLCLLELSTAAGMTCSAGKSSLIE